MGSRDSVNRSFFEWGAGAKEVCTAREGFFSLEPTDPRRKGWFKAEMKNIFLSLRG